MTKISMEVTDLFSVKQNLLYLTKDKVTESTRKKIMQQLSTQSTGSVSGYDRFLRKIYKTLYHFA